MTWRVETRAYTFTMRLPEPPRRAPILLGFSGGMDSTVLLHLLATDPGIRATGLGAIHVHHGLHAAADAWADHCLRACTALGVPLQVVRVEVDRSSGLGLEGAARAARQRAFAAALDIAAILALAHHRDDQAETFMLRALRGAGTDGLGAMQQWRPFHRGHLWRPLLDTAGTALRAYAQEHGLRWIEDSSNADDRHDRNFLRHRVLPLLRERWPHADAALARSAHHSGNASRLLLALDHANLAQVRPTAPDRIAIPELLALGPEAQARVLRLWMHELGLPPLSDNGVARVLREVVPGPRDRQPSYTWHGATISRWCDSLHAGSAQSSAPVAWTLAWDGRCPLTLPDGSQLILEGNTALDAPIQIRTRHGGERIRLPGRTHSSSLKHLLQALQLPPWARARLPLLVAADGEILAAGDQLVSDRLARMLGADPESPARIRWQRA